MVYNTRSKSTGNIGQFLRMNSSSPNFDKKTIFRLGLDRPIAKMILCPSCLYNRRSHCKIFRPRAMISNTLSGRSKFRSLNAFNIAELDFVFQVHNQVTRQVSRTNEGKTSSTHSRNIVSPLGLRCESGIGFFRRYTYPDWYPLITAVVRVYYNGFGVILGQCTCLEHHLEILGRITPKTIFTLFR